MEKEEIKQRLLGYYKSACYSPLLSAEQRNFLKNELRIIAGQLDINSGKFYSELCGIEEYVKNDY